MGMSRLALVSRFGAGTSRYRHSKVKAEPIQHPPGSDFTLRGVTLGPPPPRHPVRTRSPTTTDVRQEEFDALREGLDPETGAFLRQRQSADRKGLDGEVQSHGRHLY